LARVAEGGRVIGVEPNTTVGLLVDVLGPALADRPPMPGLDLRPLDLDAGIGLQDLRGPMTNKATAVCNIADVLTPDGVLFGGTVLGSEESHTRPARAFLWAFNKRGDFDNLEDTVDGLHGILDASFRDVEIEVAGSAACSPRPPLGPEATVPKPRLMRRGAWHVSASELRPRRNVPPFVAAGQPSARSCSHAMTTPTTRTKTPQVCQPDVFRGEGLDKGPEFGVRGRRSPFHFGDGLAPRGLLSVGAGIEFVVAARSGQRFAFDSAHCQTT